MDNELIVVRCLEELAYIIDDLDFEYDYVWNGKDEVRQVSMGKTLVALAARLRERVERIRKSI